MNFFRLNRKREQADPDDAALATLSGAVARVADALNRVGDSTTQDYKLLKKAIKRYPELAGVSMYEHGTNENDEAVFALPIFAFANKRIGASWGEHIVLLRLFHQANPNAIESINSSGSLHLHHACTMQVHPRILLYFLRHSSDEAAAQKDPLGLTPLTLYVIRCPHPRKDVISALVKAAPSAIEFECEHRELPGPLHVALIRNFKLDVLALLIPQDPSETYLKLDLDFQVVGVEGAIKPVQAREIAKRIAPWVRVLHLDTIWFTEESFATFLSTLGDKGASSLTHMFITSDILSNTNVAKALTGIIRKTPGLEGIWTRKPDNPGPSNDELYLEAIAAGLTPDHQLNEFSIFGVQGGSFTALRDIVSKSKHLKELRMVNVCFTEVGIEAISKAIRQSHSLKAVFLNSCDMPPSGFHHVAEAISLSSSIIFLNFEPNSQGQDFTPLASLTNLKSLFIEADAESSFDTNAILDLLDESGNLVALHLDGLKLPPERLLEILNRNTTLRFLKIENCLQINMMGSAIVTALRESNGTLEDVELDGKDEGTISPTLYEQLIYYVGLNKVGRGKLMQTETASVFDLASILERLSKEQDEGHEYVASTLRYGIMREMPSLWSGEYHGENEKETSLVQAVEVSLWEIEHD